MEREGNTWSCKVVTVAVKQAFTFSKSAIKAIEEGVKCVKVNNKDTITTPMMSFWCLYS